MDQWAGGGASGSTGGSSSFAFDWGVCFIPYFWALLIIAHMSAATETKILFYVNLKPRNSDIRKIQTFDKTRTLVHDISSFKWSDIVKNCNT